ncbi:MAG: xanthine dehydrogenase family protein subunit M [Planctomycetaceae bacterium]|nr:xanthine dehydrogenase family protein subunit M [Planctomycetaceae bacterium]
MKDFDYAAPTALDEAVALLAQHNGSAKILAGGTDIIVQLREGLKDADVVVDVKKIPELTELTFSTEDGLSLGASVPCYQLYENPEIVKAYGALTDAARIIGGWQIQSRASVGGNLCNSSPAADSIPSLIAHNATAHIAGPNGTRDVPVTEFCTAPGRNVLEPGELLVNLTLPAAPAKSGSAYLRFIPRNEMDIAVAGVGSWVKLSDDGSTIEEARIGVCAVAATPQFAEEASAFLAGKPATEETFAEAGELAKKVASPIDDMRGTVEYRIHLAGVLTKRTLKIACERANG